MKTIIQQNFSGQWSFKVGNKDWNPLPPKFDNIDTNNVISELKCINPQLEIIVKETRYYLYKDRERYIVTDFKIESSRALKTGDRYSINNYLNQRKLVKAETYAGYNGHSVTSFVSKKTATLRAIWAV